LAIYIDDNSQLTTIYSEFELVGRFLKAVLYCMDMLQIISDAFLCLTQFLNALQPVTDTVDCCLSGC